MINKKKFKVFYNLIMLLEEINKKNKLNNLLTIVLWTKLKIVVYVKIFKIIDISGCPGVGKTSTVMDIIKNVQC